MGLSLRVLIRLREVSKKERGGEKVGEKVIVRGREKEGKINV